MTEFNINTLDEKVDEIIKKYASYTNGKDSPMIREAYLFAAHAHRFQKRATGEPYIIHPVATTSILVDLEVDECTLIASLLHDTVEDTEVTIEEVEEKFGAEVAQLVDGVTKLNQIPYFSKEETQAENFRKMFLAMAKDIRVVLIKLADRLHNLRTMKFKDANKAYEKAQETLEIYAPLASRLGIYRVKWELEDLALRFIDQEAYYELVTQISTKRSEREEYLAQIVVQLHEKISEMGIKAEIEGRPKHFFSIYRKMKDQDKNIDEIYDLFATRIIVETVSDCYAVLGMVHELYKPLPGRFKDYIAMPKPNMYQSLHTTVVGTKGITFEVQIRTFDMHRTAEYGIAAHWRYKEGKTLPNNSQQPFEEKLTWLRQLLDWQKDMRDAGDFMDALKTGLEADEVFVFTPKGEVRSLPLHSIPIDFAYNIHSGVGNKMYGAKVNGRIVPLTYELKNGDIISILTSDKVKGPSRDWLNIVKSTSAKSKIKQWFKKEMREENIAQGKEMVEKDIRKTGFKPTQLIQEPFYELFMKKYSLKSLDDLYAGIGYGGISAVKIVSRLRDEYIKSLKEEERAVLGYRVNSSGNVVYDSVKIEMKQDEDQHIERLPQHKKKRNRPKVSQMVEVVGIENSLTRLSRCCSPVPGDDIIGYVTRGKGVAVHRKDCKNVLSILEKKDQNQESQEIASRLIDVHWLNKNSEQRFQVDLKILCNNRYHILADISAAIAEEKVPVISGQITTKDDTYGIMVMTIEVVSQEQLTLLNKKIKKIVGVYEVLRGH